MEFTDDGWKYSTQAIRFLKVRQDAAFAEQTSKYIHAARIGLDA
jgi:hypothetical protein